jgi:ubiquinone/menaquinone biosynthesis C-methylase UbiE
VLDPEGVHLAALQRLGDFRGQRMLELGCGDGRLTFQYAAAAASVLAVDPDAERIANARRSLPPELDATVSFAVSGTVEVKAPRRRFDLALFSWSL